MSLWQSRFGGNPPLLIGVNLAAKQFLQAELVAGIENVLHATGLQPCQLNLEITERTIMDNPEPAAAMVARLRKMGIQITIEDFGTGHSLSYLRLYSVDTIKIDRSLVDEMAKKDNSEIVNAFVMLAHDLNLDVVAEGGDRRPARRLKALGCNSDKASITQPWIATRRKNSSPPCRWWYPGITEHSGHTRVRPNIWTSRRPPPSSEAAGLRRLRSQRSGSRRDGEPRRHAREISRCVGQVWVAMDEGQVLERVSCRSPGTARPPRPRPSAAASGWPESSSMRNRYRA